MSESVDRGYLTKFGSLWLLFVSVLAGLSQEEAMKSNFF